MPRKASEAGVVAVAALVTPMMMPAVAETVCHSYRCSTTAVSQHDRCLLQMDGARQASCQTSHSAMWKGPGREPEQLQQ